MVILVVGIFERAFVKYQALRLFEGFVQGFYFMCG
jgi:hypothetical protein